MSYIEWFYILILAVAGFFYIGGPLILLCTFKSRWPTRILYFDPNTIWLPRDVSDFVEPARATLIAHGFRPVVYFCFPDSFHNVNAICILLVNALTNESAMLSCVYAKPAGLSTLIKLKYVEFVSRFRDGVCVQTNNSPEIGAFRPEPKEHTIQFWDIQDVAELYRRHRRISERLSTAQQRLRLFDEFRRDVEQYLQTAVMKEPCDFQVEVGIFRRASDGYRPTLKGAFILAWQELWPWKPIRRYVRRRNAQRWLREIGFNVPS